VQGAQFRSLQLARIFFSLPLFSWDYSMTVYAQHLSAKQAPQTEAIPGREAEMKPNNAGGVTFVVDDWAQLDRFLILGSPGGTYYVGERKLTQENAAVVLRCLAVDAQRTVERIATISEQGRAPKNDPAVFALALCASLGSAEGKSLALAALSRVCRIPTHLFAFVANVQELRGWGRGLRRAVGEWYTEKGDARSLAYHVVKYQAREGFTHRDLLRLSHPKATGLTQEVLHYAVKGWESVGEEPHPEKALLPIWAAERAKRVTTKAEVVRLIADYDLVRECIPTQWLNEPEVWEALLVKMPLTAMVRNLGKMTAVGLLKPLSEAARKVVATLGSEDALKRARVHPISLLVALKTYAQGKGDKGKLTWTPAQEVVNALDEAFYLAFVAVEPTGKRWFIGMDVSGSMSAAIAGTPLSCAEAVAALALVTAATEPWTFLAAFCDRFVPVPFTKKTRLDEALRMTRAMNFGRTDCAIPMLAAMQNKMDVDAFAVLTDSETYMGSIQPSQALAQYRQQSGIPARLIVNGMTATNFTIADPKDAGMFDVAGFDTATPAVMADFVRG
jgi:60 kDa SS-A/Ro ribonucleoprotein